MHEKSHGKNLCHRGVFCSGRYVFLLGVKLVGNGPDNGIVAVHIEVGQGGNIDVAGNKSPDAGIDALGSQLCVKCAGRNRVSGPQRPYLSLG